MKRPGYKMWLFMASAVYGTLLISSCNPERLSPPAIVFKTGTAYISKDTSLTHGTIFNVGVQANKTGTDGILTSFKIAKSVNGGQDSVFHEMSFFYQTFSPNFSYTAGDSGTTERYTFTVKKNDGLENSVSLAITNQ